MPMYTYRCNNCGNEFDLRQSFYDDPIRDCSVCEGDVRRVIQQVPVLFKGSGFYVTDNRNGRNKDSGNGKGPKVSETSSESDKSMKEDKPAAAAEKTDKNKSTSTASSKSD